MRKLADCQVVARCQLYKTIPATLARVAFRDWWQRAVRIESGGIVAEHDRARRDRAVVVYETIEPPALRARLFDRIADDNKSAWQHLQMVTRTGERFDPSLLI